MKIIEAEDKTIVFGTNFGSKAIQFICSLMFFGAAFVGYARNAVGGLSGSDWFWMSTALIMGLVFFFMIVIGAKQRLVITSSSIEIKYGLRQIRIENEVVQLFVYRPTRFPGWQVSIESKRDKNESVVYHFARKMKAEEFVEIIQRRYKQPIEINPPRE